MSINASNRVLYSDPDENGNQKYWYPQTLWKAAENAVIVELELDSLNILDEVVWFGGPKNVRPTVRNISNHVKDILNVDMSFPIIKMKDGDILDGAHRIARAYIENNKFIKAAILNDMPTHDGVILAGEAAPPGKD